jgi:hypothetical protein
MFSKEAGDWCLQRDRILFQNIIKLAKEFPAFVETEKSLPGSQD